MISKFLVVLVTVPDTPVGEKLSKGLVQNKLAACVNRVSGIRSRYWWKGKIETAREELLLIKTSQSKFPLLNRWIKKNHPYTVCEIIAIPVAGGNKDYFRWIGESLRK